MYFVDTLDWRKAEIDQALATGDALRTGPLGGLAILFLDQTQIRVHRNTLLEIRYVGTEAEPGKSAFKLEQGAVWSRMRRGLGSRGVTFETPAATAAIRGTDWYLSVDADKSTLVVLDGSVEFFNEFGSLQVTSGEIATAVVGQAPTKRILVAPKDQPRWVLDLSLEWFNILSLTGLPMGTLLSAKPDPADPLGWVEGLCDLGDYRAAEKALAQTLEDSTAAAASVQSSRIDLIRALLSARQRRFKEAESLFREAAPKLEGRRRLIALLGLVGTFVETGQLQQADSTLRAVERETVTVAEVGMSRAWLDLFAGDYDAAVARISAVRSQYPHNARADIVVAQLYLLINDTENMEAAIAAALEADPNDYLAWHWKGLLHQKVRLDADLAREAYEKALTLNPTYGFSWNNLGLLHLELGDYHKAEAALLTAINTDPKNALFHANYGVVLSVQERLREAEQAFVAADQLELNQSDALAGQGILALKEGRTDKSVDRMLEANVADPSLPGGDALLGVSLYQAGHVQAAQQTLANAARIDRNDPLPPLINSVIAQDQADAGTAIRLARDAHERLQRTGSLAVEGIASSQSGITNVGSAYANLGLNDWGTYYSQLGFSPYLASSHFFLANEYASVRARSSSNTQGLLLDPTAVSFPNRFTEFVREPRTDLELASSIGSDDGALTHTESVTLQGFARIPNPFAYSVIASNADDDGFRPNSQSQERKLLLGLGGWLDSSNYLLFRGNYDKSSSGLPDSRDISDPDDEQHSETFNTELGYQHRFDARNRILLRLAAAYSRDRFTNPQPFGVGLSDVDLSLVDYFGLDRTHRLYKDGLFGCHVPELSFCPSPPDVALVFGEAGTILGLPRLQDNIPRNLDLKTVGSLATRDRPVLLQTRHMFNLANVDLSYGLELEIVNTELKTAQTVLSQVGHGLIVDRDGNTIQFPVSSASLKETSTDFDQKAGAAYLDGQWEPDPALRVQASGFVRYFDDGINDAKTEFDPRLGVAWQPAPHHWLRVAAQREFILPFAETLAPVATVGLVAPDDFLQPGGTSTDFQARWDAEWLRNVFTFVNFEEQWIKDFFETVPLSITRSFAVDDGRVRSVSAGTNIWFAERFGLFAKYRRAWTENRSDGPNHGNDLPLIPDDTADTGLTYVHPWQIRATVAESYVGRRPSDAENSTTLGGYWVTNLTLNWQPDDRHWSLTLGIDNLFDRDYEVAAGFPAPGRTALVGVAYRF